MTPLHDRRQGAPWAGWPRLRAHPQGTRGHKRSRVYYLTLYVPGASRCAIGGEVLHQPPRLVDLAHSDDGTHYLGLACRRHNRSPGTLAGSRKTGRIGNRIVAKQRTRDERERIEQRERTNEADQRESERRERIEQRERERRTRRLIIVAGDDEAGRS